MVYSSTLPNDDPKPPSGSNRRRVQRSAAPGARNAGPRFAGVPRLSMGTAVIYGCGAGVLGACAMTLTEKLEQLLTRRPNSYVPGYTLLRLLRLPETQLSTASIWRFNMAMHYGQGALAGGIRAMMALYGVRGPFADFMFAGVRLCIDQGLENWMGVGAPPWTWPVEEQVVDILHKVVYALVAGYLCDLWIQ